MVKRLCQNQSKMKNITLFCNSGHSEEYKSQKLSSCVLLFFFENPLRINIAWSRQTDRQTDRQTGMSIFQQDPAFSYLLSPRCIGEESTWQGKTMHENSKIPIFKPRTHRAREETASFLDCPVVENKEEAAAIVFKEEKKWDGRSCCNSNSSSKNDKRFAFPFNQL